MDDVDVSTKIPDKTFNKKTKVGNTHGSSNIKSWIWLYFDSVYINNVRHAVCKVELVKRKKCSIKYKVNTSTSNCSTHLANIHRITEDQAKDKNVTELVNLPYDELCQLQLYQYLVN
ncbi:17189_t:CDS:1 [Cetraspora pellucida]|uniref:17189_t:CDS:1 n=1 Tax=Cetraspora pellucida TaxID=1433469 RepID=A0A9N9F789_9GLOM|nr:17189_t:CDS:1 [Cetraspora pellucida]